MAKVRRNVKPVKVSHISPFSIYWTKQNFVFLIAGLIVIIIGYYLMSLGKWNNPVSLIASPILLILGYLVLLPLSIFYRKKQKDTSENL